jgi:DNA-binding NtrC family response regulator
VSQQQILVIDQDATDRTALCENLASGALEVKTADGTVAAITSLTREHFDAVLCNLVMEDGGGMKVLRFIRDRSLQIPLIIIAHHADWEIAQDCLSAGAFDFVTKPIDQLSMRAVVRRALLRSGLIFEDILQAPETPAIGHFPFLVGSSPQMTELLRQIAKIGPVDSTVCVYGESGVGKELAARAIHCSSHRSDRPLIVLDCAAIPENLMESEMFGHVKGAFTSAIADREGVFQLADGGTLFIDEVGELTPSLQAKLLRVIQTREFRKVGGKHSIKVDVRIIAATNKDLRARVADGGFREDLYYRLEVIPLTIPPLRHRKDDIPALVDYFIKGLKKKNTKQVHGVSARMMAALLRYDWPGNVRELENCIERAVVMTEGKMLDIGEDLTFFLRNTGSHDLQHRPILEADRAPRSLRESRRDAERDLIFKALQTAGGNRTRAAALLGVSLRNLHYKLRAFQLADASPIRTRVGPTQPRAAVADL